MNFQNASRGYPSGQIQQIYTLLTKFYQTSGIIQFCHKGSAKTDLFQELEFRLKRYGTIKMWGKCGEKTIKEKRNNHIYRLLRLFFVGIRRFELPILGLESLSAIYFQIIDCSLTGTITRSDFF